MEAWLANLERPLRDVLVSCLGEEWIELEHQKEPPIDRLLPGRKQHHKLVGVGVYFETVDSSREDSQNSVLDNLAGDQTVDMELYYSWNNRARFIGDDYLSGGTKHAVQIRPPNTWSDLQFSNSGDFTTVHFPKSNRWPNLIFTWPRSWPSRILLSGSIGILNWTTTDKLKLINQWDLKFCNIDPQWTFSCNWAKLDK